MLSTDQGHWLSSAPAKKFFKFASIIFLVAIVFLGVALAGVLVAGEDWMQHYTNQWWLQVIGFLLGVAGAPCGIALWIGMFSHWAFTNQSPKSVRAAWFFLFIFGNWIVALLYYFGSYRKQSAAATVEV